MALWLLGQTFMFSFVFFWGLIDQRKPRSYVRTLIYRMWCIVIRVADQCEELFQHRDDLTTTFGVLGIVRQCSRMLGNRCQVFDWRTKIGKSVECLHKDSTTNALVFSTFFPPPHGNNCVIQERMKRGLLLSYFE